MSGLNPKSWTKLEINYNDEPGFSMLDKAINGIHDMILIMCPKEVFVKNVCS